jgi:peptide chain release factor 3
MGADFHGAFDFRDNGMIASSAGRGGASDIKITFEDVDDPRLAERVSGPVLREFREQAMLAREGYSAFDIEQFRAGHLTPVIFGSALRDTSVEELLRLIAENAPPPRPQASAAGTVDPGDDAVSGFVFKVQANMDPNHRDRIAFMRLCSGRFQRGMKLKQVRTGKTIAVQSPVLFFGQDRQIADEAVAGDVVGVPNHGTLRVGDTLSEDSAIRFTGLPSFAPEVLRRVLHGDASKVKAVRQALEDLAEEGLVQVFRPLSGGYFVVGVVGILQLDVLTSRIAGEYNAEIVLEPVPYSTARWVTSDQGEPAIEAFKAENRASLAEDRDGRLVFLARNPWDLENTMKRYPAIAFRDTCELAG